MKPLAVSLCDRTGNMLRPWAEGGWECIAVDVQHGIRSEGETRDGITYIWGDCRSWTPPRRPDIVFGFSPCTHLAVSGARDFERKSWPMLRDGMDMFFACLMAARWAGCRRWHERGCLEEPIEVSAATDDYRDAENPLSEFIEAKLAIDPDAFLPSSELRRLYNAWCDLSNVNQKMGDRALANRIAEVKGVKPDKQRVNGVSCRGFSGIRGAQ